MYILLSFFQLRDTSYYISISCLSMIEQQWTWISTYLFSRISCPLGLCLKVLQLDLVVDLCLVSSATYTLFPKWLYQIPLSPAVNKYFPFTTSTTNVYYHDLSHLLPAAINLTWVPVKSSISSLSCYISLIRLSLLFCGCIFPIMYRKHFHNGHSGLFTLTIYINYHSHLLNIIWFLL